MLQSRGDSKTRAALKIQAAWRRGLHGVLNDKKSLLHLVHLKKRKKEIRDRIIDISLYTLFLICFSASAVYIETDLDYYYFGHGVRDQLTGVEFQERHSPTFAKRYGDLVTITEWYQWLEGVFLPDAYLSQGWDLSESGESGGVPNKGYILGSGKVLGGIRIGQLRLTKNPDCNSKMPSIFLGHDNACYGNADGEFTAATEDKADFGHPDGPLRFQWEGLNGTSTSKEREMVYSDDYAKTMRLWPAPAYGVVLPNPTDPNAFARAAWLVRGLRDSQYVDIHTRAVYVDVNVYNGMLNKLLVVRMVTELSKAGGLLPVVKSYTVPVHWCAFAGGMPLWQQVVAGVVLAFYVFFLVEEWQKIRKQGFLKYWSFKNFVVNLNVLCYAGFWAAKLTAWHVLPDPFRVNTDRYVYYFPYASLQMVAKYVNAVNAVLCVLKILFYLNISPQFALINGTMARAWQGVRSFIFIFLIILYAFAFAFLLTFSTSVLGFANLSATLKTLTKALLGEFNLDEMYDAHWLMGPLLFFFFVCLAVFVTLNMVIAIISDAYTATCKDIEKMEDVKFGAEMVAFVDEMLAHAPYPVGPAYRRATRAAKAEIRVARKASSAAIASVHRLERNVSGYLHSPSLHGSSTRRLRRSSGPGSKGSRGAAVSWHRPARSLPPVGEEAAAGPGQGARSSRSSNSSSSSSSSSSKSAVVVPTTDADAEVSDRDHVGGSRDGDNNDNSKISDCNRTQLTSNRPLQATRSVKSPVLRPLDPRAYYLDTMDEEKQRQRKTESDHLKSKYLVGAPLRK